MKIISRLGRDEKGQVFIITMILLLIGSIIIPALLSNMASGVKTSTTYEKKLNEYYAADAGIEDARWQVKYDHLSDTIPTYNQYNYSASYTYTAPSANNQQASVGIQNIWMPTDLAAPSMAQASGVINGVSGYNHLIITGGVSAANTFKIKLQYYQVDGTLHIRSVGVWLPSGFVYDSSSDPLQIGSNNITPTVMYHRSGQAVVWNCNNSLFTDFPDFRSGPPMASTFDFKFLGPTGENPSAVAWVDTDQDLSGGLSCNYTWDDNIKIFKAESTVGSTEVVALFAKNALRQLISAIAGDYYATGQSLMQDTNGDPQYRELLLTSSSSSVSAIPSNAVVQAAYLYWSGYVHDKANGILWDQCDYNHLTDKWQSNGNWSVDNSGSGNSYTDKFKGTGNASTLTMKNSLDLSGITTTATISWDQNGNTTPVFSDPGTSPISTYWNTASPTDWSYSSGAYRAKYNSGYDTTLTHSQDLSYIPSASTTTISWKWWSDPTLGSGSGLNVAISSDGVNFTQIDSFSGPLSSPQTRTYVLSDTYLTTTFKIRFTLVGSSTKYRYVDDINITASPDPNTLHLKISKDNGSTWLDEFASNNFPSNPSVLIPADYLTSQFKIQFYLSGFVHSGDYVTIDNVLITDDSITSHYDPNITFTIKKDTETIGHTETITALSHTGDFAWPAIGDDTSSEVLSGGITFDGYYYACKSDVTDLVKNYSNGADLTASPNVYGDGNGTYTIGDIYSDTESVMNPGKLADSGYAGWSLIIIYTSPDTKGHSLFIYDYSESSNYTRSVPNQNSNGSAYVISIPVGGFIVPNKITGETDANDAAKLTIFVGEGDIKLTGDHVNFTGQNLVTKTLWDGVTNDSNDTQSNPNNVWNSEWIDQSSGSICSIPGIDVDTCHIKWGDSVGGVKLINTGDTSGTLTLSTHGDGYVLIYTIISFRSEATTGNSISYLINQH